MIQIFLLLWREIAVFMLISGAFCSIATWLFCRRWYGPVLEEKNRRLYYQDIPKPDYENRPKN